MAAAGEVDGDDETSDEDLAARMLGGDAEAARFLLERYRRPLYGLLLRLTRSPEDAADLFQETFLRVLRAGGRYDRRRPLRPWLFAIAVNLARDRARVLARDERPRLGAEGDLPEPKGSPGAAEIEDRRLRRADLARALGELPQPQREVVVLRYYLGLEEPEIALAVGIPRGTVKSRLHTAIRRMRARLTR